MASERFTVIALPFARDAGAPFHVSLFVAPDLTPDGSEGVLGDFTHFLHWAAVLRDEAAIELRDQQGAIPAEPLTAALEPAVWDAVFPPDTPVRRRSLPDFDGRRWRTFRAAELHDGAKVLHAMAIFSDPVSPPLPSAHPLGGLMRQLGVAFERGYDERVLTRGFDRAIGEPAEGEPGEVIPLNALEKRLDAEEPWSRFTLQLHRARRFYERPESKLAYRERPDGNATSQRPPRPEPDFHERCAFVGDLPSLQRRLGLVLDLRVPDPARLATSQWLEARIVPQGDTAAGRRTRTRCQTAGDDLVAVPAGEDWARGRLRLGDAERFALLDMDPDGSALKLDRYLWSLPRLLIAEANREPVHAAPTALRSLGFAVVRHRRALGTQARLDRQKALQTALGKPTPPLLDAEDVIQGFRVEVWDDHVKAWHTLHARRITAEALGHGTVVSDSAEEGFIQGTTATETVDVDDSPVHVHESLFGWEGWSLSAPRPGKRVRHEAGNEVVEDPGTDPDPVTPLVVTSEAEPGTLPRLRYGRRYAFRAWSVDLAGNSRRHALGPAPSPAASSVSAVAAALASVTPVAGPTAALGTLLRDHTVAALAARRETLTVSREVPVADFTLGLGLDHAVDRAVLHRLRRRRGDGAPIATTAAAGPTAGRAALVGRAFAEALAPPSDDATEDRAGGVPALALISDTAIVDAASLARTAAVSAALDRPRVLDRLRLVTPLRPFLRWDPVQPPAVVARHAHTAGESLRQVVIRSGVEQDLETLEITVTPPADYAAVPALSALGYRATSERHLVPPKTSQSEAELHGAFDRAIGSLDPGDHGAMLAVALREAGTLFDVDVPRLDDPSVRDSQLGIALEHDPEVPASTLKALPLPQGEMPAPGQYVVHDVDELALPYLPDVVARGISLVFPEAGRDRQLRFPFGTEGFTATYGGDWPERQPFRLVLEGAAELFGALEGRTLRIALPPGDVQRFRLSSSLGRDDLVLFGLWRMLPEEVRNAPEVAEAAADGWLWALTPFDDVALVHAVPRPLEAPRPTRLVAVRPGEGATDVALGGAVDVHGPSTDSLTAEARWVDPVDDLTLPGPEERASRGVAFTTRIREAEDLAVLGGGPQDLQVPIQGFGPVWVHSAIHRLGDTRHHTIRYRFRAATRFREYFDPVALEPPAPGNGDGELPVDDGQSVVGPELELTVPSSAKPAAPIVHSVLPLFRWDDHGEPEQPVARRRRRRAGVRIYLERPWYSSGEGELLGVLLAPGDDAALKGIVSQWGADPVWLSAEIPRRAMALELDNLLHASGLDDRPGDALPVVPPATLPLATVRSRPTVAVLGYRPQFSLERGKWYVDVAIDPGTAFWPFVRLAVARYQPDSIADCHLSAPVTCDFVQMTPERTTSVSRTDVRHVRVVVSGPVGVRTLPGGGFGPQAPFPEPDIERLASRVAANRLVVARLQQRDPAIPTDLGWQTVASVELVVRGTGRNPFEAAWVGELEAPEDLPLRRPGENPDWRVTVEEWERLPGDPADLGSAGFLSAPPEWEQRLIYADEIAL